MKKGRLIGRVLWIALAFVMIGAMLGSDSSSLITTAAPTRKASDDSGVTTWSSVSTPSEESWVLTPEFTTVDYAVGDDGEMAYAIVGKDGSFYLLKSVDHAATWNDITKAIKTEITRRTGFDGDEDDLEATLWKVACDAQAPGFVAVALGIPNESRYGPWQDTVRVLISSDGGASFRDAGEVTAGLLEFGEIFAFAVASEVGGMRNIAIGGADGDEARLFRCLAIGDIGTGWVDALYEGWDDGLTGNSWAVVDIHFAPSWATDNTILVASATNTTVYLQSGTWGTVEAWNTEAGFADAVPIISGVEIPLYLGHWVAGINTPSDYTRHSTKRYAWVNVNYIHPDDGPVGKIFRVINTSVNAIDTQVAGEPWLTNVSYLGTIASGKAIASLLGKGTFEQMGTAQEGCMDDLKTDCCEGVQVHRNADIADMEICCLAWKPSCKPPTGKTVMEVMYVTPEKAYAVALWGAWRYDEGAWSWTFDDGETWNQLSLIDTRIDYLSDVAVSPDCNKTMLVSVNEEIDCGCDSVWLKGENLPEAEEYSGKWLRTWSGELQGDENYYYDWGLLRLAPEETNGETVYLVDYGTSTVYWNDLQTLACWEKGTATVDYIVDLAVKDKDTIYALDESGAVAMSTGHGDTPTWSKSVDSEVDYGNTIAVWGDHILVGGADGEVSYSDDGGETFALLEQSPTIDGYVTVAFDTYFDTNNVIYAATDEDDYTGGIYRWVIGESESWTNLHADPLECDIGVDDGDELYEVVEVAFTGLVVGRPSNPFTSADNGGVIYASYYGYYDGQWFTGVARSLERKVTINMTCVQWDFLHVGLTIDADGFNGWPDALKICGCLTPDSNTHLFAIDAWLFDHEYGSVWTYEDCYAKTAPALASPADGATIRANPHSCINVPFTLEWDHLGDACVYHIQIARDADFTEGVLNILGYEPGPGKGARYRVPKGTLSCGVTYYWRVRSAKDDTGQVIHSWWSEPRSFTVIHRKV